MSTVLRLAYDRQRLSSYPKHRQLVAGSEIRDYLTSASLDETPFNCMSERAVVIGRF